ncbi:MAG: radical SAM protein [Muribaculaceae bacterium]|nr:radical SAM protein [Muribaculaceae bacterium]
MYIDRILYPIETLGPGKRLVIWVRGCSRHCKGCANPELWDISNSKYFPVEDIAQIIQNIYADSPFDGVTISGGDPLEQKEELLLLLDEISKITDDVLLYTGYTYQEVCALLTKEELMALMGKLSVLIDGPYVEKLNTKDAVLRGSSNQQIIYCSDKYREKYEEYLLAGRKIQNVYMGNQLISVGIHNRKEQET